MIVTKINYDAPEQWSHSGQYDVQNCVILISDRDSTMDTMPHTIMMSY